MSEKMDQKLISPDLNNLDRKKRLTEIDTYLDKFYTEESGRFSKNIIMRSVLKRIAQTSSSGWWQDWYENKKYIAVDHHIIPSDEYWKYLIEEIYRATEPSGIITGVSGGTLSKLFSENGKFKVIKGEPNEPSYNLEYYIFEKI